MTRVLVGMARVLVGMTRVLVRMSRVLVRMTRVLVRMTRVLVRMCAVLVLVDRELRRRHPRPQDLVRVDVGVAERQASERGLQRVERQTGIDERAKRHVAGDSREAIEIQHAAHNRPDSLKLQYRASPSTR